MDKYLTWDLLFWIICSVDCYFPTDVSGQIICPIFKDWGSLTLEDGTRGLYRNAGMKIPIYTAYNSRRSPISFTTWRQKPEITKSHLFPRWYRHSWPPLYLILEAPHTWPKVCNLWQYNVMDINSTFSPSIICHLYFYPCLYCPHNSLISHLYICFVISDFIKVFKRYAHIT